MHRFELCSVIEQRVPDLRDPTGRAVAAVCWTFTKQGSLTGTPDTPIPDMYNDKEYDILEIIHENPQSVRQRDLASAADLSLGMTNAVLKKLVIKGLLVMKRVNSRNIQYALTPEGMAEVAWRSKRLLKRTLQNVAQYRDGVEHIVQRIKGQGYQAVRFNDKSDLDFILEWACLKNGIHYNDNPGPDNSNQLELTENDILEELKGIL